MFHFVLIEHSQASEMQLMPPTELRRVHFLGVVDFRKILVDYSLKLHAVVL